jgi:hypothetical protein
MGADDGHCEGARQLEPRFDTRPGAGLGVGDMGEAKSNEGEMSMPSSAPSRSCGGSSCRLLFDPGVVRRSGDRVG